MNTHRVLNPSEVEFNELLRIYTAAFSASERKPLPVLMAMLARPEYLFLAATEDNTVLGFSIAIAFQDSDAALLEYIAIDPANRGRGIGQFLFRETVARPEMDDRLMLIELDAESPDRARVMQFYRRFGCRQIARLTYRMPRVSSAEPPLMDLLVYAPELPATTEKSTLRSWLEACYTQVYDQPATDPRIESMLAPLPDPVPLI